MSFAPAVLGVFMQALILAESHGHRQIGVGDLSNAVAMVEGVGAAEPKSYPLHPVSKREKLFSKPAQRIIQAAIDMAGPDEVTLDDLRSALRGHRDHARQ
jgi:hypothetical protein